VVGGSGGVELCGSVYITHSSLNIELCVSLFMLLTTGEHRIENT
jgi:hypothetical protein